MRSAYFYTIAIWMDGIYTYVSPNYDRTFGLGEGALRGKHFSVMLNPEKVKIYQEAGQKCFEAPIKSRLCLISFNYSCRTLNHHGKNVMQTCRRQRSADKTMNTRNQL